MCRWTIFLSIGIVCCLVVPYVTCDKKPNKMKRPEKVPRDKMDRPKFRSVRVQQVWDKAQRMGKEGLELEKLAIDLTKYDEKMYQLKKLERDGQDPTGERTEQMHKKLTVIMQDHGLIPKERPTEYVPTKDRPFEDNRLNGLWRKTLEAEHFDKQEVKLMKQQLKLHQEKINQYQDLVDDLYGKDKKMHPNDIDARKNSVKKEDFQAKELELKLQHKKLNKDFQLLSVKTMPEEERGGFNEPRIINFWKEAKQANFTEEELSSLKEELRHFEGKLFKYDKVQEDAIKAEQAYKKKKISGEKVDSKKHNMLKDKVREIGSSVKSFFNEMKERISSRKSLHNEL